MTKYRILFGIKIIRIPHANTTIMFNYLNSIQIPNYLSHPERNTSFCTQKYVGNLMMAPLSQDHFGPFLMRATDWTDQTGDSDMDKTRE